MLHEVSFKSFNQRDMVQGWIYVPACAPKGIVQLIHGFGEHSRRYLHMISAFMDAGYIVTADDHVGHGRTAVANGVWADWGEKGPHTMMEDEHSLKEIVCEKYPGLPYFLFGHSMGSFITRDFMVKYGGELAGAAEGNFVAEPTNDAIYINGVKADLTAYKIEGNNFFRLRDLGKTLDFYGGWTPERGVFIETDKPYSD